MKKNIYIGYRKLCIYYLMSIFLWKYQLCLFSIIHSNFLPQFPTTIICLIFTSILYLNSLPQLFTSILYCNSLPQFFTSILYLNYIPQLYTSILYLIFYLNYLSQWFTQRMSFLHVYYLWVFPNIIFTKNNLVNTPP